MEASALSSTASSPPALLGRTPLLRLQGDEKLVAMTRRGSQAAFDTLVHRYQGRLLSFCRHMLGSAEDAEDVLQEVFASAYNAIMADNRPINARPWLYRIARNRSLNHLRRPQPSGQDSMDVYERAGGETTADAVHRREDFRLLIADVQELPETQRTALLMREIDALSYEQIAEAMETTVSSVKSLLVRARVGLAEAAEARMLSCDDARLELAEVAEGIGKASAPVRRHVKTCDRCRVFRGELRRTTRALAAVYPAGPLVALEKLFLGKLGFGGGSGAGAGAGAGASAGGSGAIGSTTVAGGSVWGGSAAAGGSALSGGLVSAGAGAGGLLSTGVGAIATKAAAGLVAAAVVTAGAVEIKHVVDERAAVPAPVEASHGPRDDSAPDAGAALGPAGATIPAGEAAAAETPPAPAPDGLEAGLAAEEGSAPAGRDDGTLVPTEGGARVSGLPGEAPTGGEVPTAVLPIATGGGSSGSEPASGGDSGSGGAGEPSGSSDGSDGGSSGGDTPVSPEPSGVGGSSDPAPAPAGEPVGSSTWASPEMHFNAGEPAGSGF